ncbi:transglycosylase family protein [Actinomycetes bacterium KLBMP 9759]
MARYRGRHRAPSNTGRVIARTALAGAVAGVPLLASAPSAFAASDSTWDRLAMCESTGDWGINTGNGYSGGLQFSPRTWKAFGGAEFASAAHQASRAEQIVVAERVLAAQTWKAWPACSKKLGLSEGATLRKAPASDDDAPAQKAAFRNPTATTGAYVVKSGDTLSKIATRNGVAGGWKTLLDKNPGLGGNPNKLTVGQKLTV